VYGFDCSTVLLGKTVEKLGAYRTFGALSFGAGISAVVI
jgi:hypothetical protein